MELFTLKCAQCGAAIKYVSGATHLRCDYCGAEYILKPDAGEKSGNGLADIDYMGRGALFRAFVPQGWGVRVLDDTQSFSKLAAVCKGLRLDSPQGNAMLFFPFAYFKSFNPNGIGGSGIKLRQNYQFDPATLTRYRAITDIESYARERIAELNPEAVNIRLRALDDMDGALQSKAQAFASEAAQKLSCAVLPMWAKFAVEYDTPNGSGAALFAAVLAAPQTTQQPEPAQTQAPAGGAQTNAGGLRGFLDFGMKGGIIGAMRRGESTAVPGVKLPDFKLGGIGGFGGMAGPDWGRGFDAALFVNGSSVEGYNDIFNDFCLSVQCGALYYALADEELRQTQQIMLDGARQRQQMAFNASQRLQQTLSETSDIVTSGYAQRSQVMDDIGRRRSEGIRGVNTYERRDGGEVEASVSYEHVYQNNAGDFGASRSHDPNVGPEWTELKRKD